MTLDEIRALQAGDHILYTEPEEKPHEWEFHAFANCSCTKDNSYYRMRNRPCEVCAGRGVAGLGKHASMHTPLEIVLFGYPERWTFLGDPLELFVRVCMRQADDARRSEINQAG